MPSTSTPSSCRKPGYPAKSAISDNKQYAKVAIGFAKPARIFTITYSNEMTLTAARPVEELQGVKLKIAKNLEALGNKGVAARTQQQRVADFHLSVR